MLWPKSPLLQHLRLFPHTLKGSFKAASSKALIDSLWLVALRIVELNICRLCKDQLSLSLQRRCFAEVDASDVSFVMSRIMCLGKGLANSHAKASRHILTFPQQILLFRCGVLYVCCQSSHIFFQLPS
jgi:hypothetical protein